MRPGNQRSPPDDGLRTLGRMTAIIIPKPVDPGNLGMSAAEMILTDPS
jgi:hypothetical protein